GVAAVDDVLRDPARLVDRDGEGQADVAGGVGVGADRLDHRVDPDDPAGRIHQRTAGVAGVDRGVGLDGGVVPGRPARLVRLDGAVDRADDAGGHGVAQRQRRTEREYRIADQYLVGVAELHRRQAGPVQLEYRDVGLLVGADQPGRRVAGVAEA